MIEKYPEAVVVALCEMQKSTWGLWCKGRNSFSFLFSITQVMDGSYQA